MYLIIDADQTEECYFKITDLFSKNKDLNEKEHFWEDYNLEQHLVDYYLDNEDEKQYANNLDDFIDKSYEEFMSMSWEEILDKWVLEEYKVVENLNDLNRDDVFYRENYDEPVR